MSPENCFDTLRLIDKLALVVEGRLPNDLARPPAPQCYAAGATLRLTTARGWRSPQPSIAAWRSARATSRTASALTSSGAATAATTSSHPSASFRRTGGEFTDRRRLHLWPERAPGTPTWPSTSARHLKSPAPQRHTLGLDGRSPVRRLRTPPHELRPQQTTRLPRRPPRRPTATWDA